MRPASLPPRRQRPKPHLALASLRLAAAAALACLLPRTAAQPAMVTVLANGPVSNRLNIVLFSEGYTTNQLSQFWSDATNAVMGMNQLLSHPPYIEYSNYFNAFAIGVASIDSGSTHPADGIVRNTYFQSSYDASGGDLITMTTAGQKKVDALLTNFMPRCQLPILLVNEPFYDGGSDGFDQTAIASIAPMITNILTHETGHVLANLGDEYTNSRTGITVTTEPNTTQDTQRNLIQWKAWIDPATPIPTPATADYTDVIGLFQGANYHATGWYRPKFDCCMNHKETPFCEVCSEALVRAIYKHVRPVDNFTPVTTNVSFSPEQGATFRVDLLQPATHNLAVQWLLDGTPIPGATNLAYTPQPLGPGKHALSVVVHDPTSLVRNDPTGLLTQTVTWTLFPPLLEPSIQSNRFTFCFQGQSNSTFLVQSTTNLAKPLWSVLATNHGTGGWITNWSSATNSVSRFYRVLVQ